MQIKNTLEFIINDETLSYNVRKKLILIISKLSIQPNFEDFNDNQSEIGTPKLSPKFFSLSLNDFNISNDTNDTNDTNENEYENKSRKSNDIILIESDVESENESFQLISNGKKREFFIDKTNKIKTKTINNKRRKNKHKKTKSAGSNAFFFKDIGKLKNNKNINNKNYKHPMINIGINGSQLMLSNISSLPSSPPSLNLSQSTDDVKINKKFNKQNKNKNKKLSPRPDTPGYNSNRFRSKSTMRLKKISPMNEIKEENHSLNSINGINGIKKKKIIKIKKKKNNNKK